jgi:hypothetical protein
MGREAVAAIVAVELEDTNGTLESSSLVLVINDTKLLMPLCQVN